MYAISSVIEMQNISLININFNCLYLIECRLNMNNTYFVNQNYSILATFTLISITLSYPVFIQNFVCIGNEYQEIQFIQLINMPKLIFVYKSYFKFGVAPKGGSIKIKDSKIEINMCVCYSNRAIKGGAIYYESISGKKIIYN